MKRIVSFILTVVMLTSVFFIVPSYAETPVPSIEAEAAIVMDMSTGKILYEVNADEKMYPASTTKMMTAILALENLDIDKKLTCDDEVAATKGSVLGLKNGEEVPIRQLLYATMVRSANDGAVALAKAVAPNVESFADMMNLKALELGCTGTHFVNPSGLHDDEHYSTAHDLALIANYCMQNETFRDIVIQPNYTLPATNLSEPRSVDSTNLMLYDTNDANRIYVGNELRYCKYDDCIGIKTGYTPEAQGCLVSAATKHGTSILCVVLKSSNYGRFADSIKLLDWAFANYRTVNVMSAGTTFSAIRVKRGAVNKVGIELADDIIRTIPSEASDSVVSTELQLEEELTAPVSKGQKVGVLILYESGIEKERFKVVATEDVSEGGILSNFYIEDATAKRIGLTVLGVFLFIVALLVSYVLIKRAELKRKKARRAAKLKAKQEEEARRRQMWEREYDERYHRYTDPDE